MFKYIYMYVFVYMYMFSRTQNIPLCFSWPLKYSTRLQVVHIIHSLQFHFMSREASKPGAALGYLQLPQVQHLAGSVLVTFHCFHLCCM